MAPKVKVTINEQGHVVADFVAFPGRSCQDAEEHFRKELEKWGLVLDASVSPKTQEQIEQELARDGRETRTIWNDLSV